VIAEVRDIVTAPQFSWAQVSIRKSALWFGGLPIPVIRIVVAPYFFAISKACMLNILVPRCENTTTMSLSETTYFDLTKSKLCTDKGSVLAALSFFV
jgi:hypothetical protein